MNTRLGVILVAGLTALMAAAPACADPGDERPHRRFWLRGDDADSARAERIERMERVERVERMREFRRNHSAFVRMTPEERQQLRHDIRAAREGVYHRQRPPPPDEESSR